MTDSASDHVRIVSPQPAPLAGAAEAWTDLPDDMLRLLHRAAVLESVLSAMRDAAASIEELRRPGAAAQEPQS